jgi:hypothetical protein
MKYDNSKRAAIAFARTHCKHGHELSSDNVRYVTRRGGRLKICGICSDAHCLKKDLGKYNLSPEKFNEMSKEQGGVCAISGMPPTEGGRFSRLSVDHDHVSGQVRRLLHSEINRALGMFRENPEWLRRAADYIEYWNKEREKSCLVGQYV